MRSDTRHEPSSIRAAGTLALAVLVAFGAFTASGCKSPSEYHREADDVAGRIITDKQQAALGRTEPFTIESPEDTLRKRLFFEQGLVASDAASMSSACVETPEDWPEERTPEQCPPPGDADEVSPIVLSLFEALEVAAANSRDYQTQKENVFRTALALDLERDEFRSSYRGLVDAVFVNDLSSGSPENSLESTTDVSWSKLFENGVSVTAGLALDLVKLLTGGREETLGIAADASLSVPLLRGAGRRIVTEPLTQAERNVVYAIHDFERFKRTFAVRVASDYLAVLESLDQIRTAEENYRSLIKSTRRAARLADAGRLPEIQLDQARQDELRARDRWISAIQRYESAIDSFRITLGLPPDAQVELDRDELDRLAELARDATGYAGEPADAESADVREPADADAPVILEEPERNVGPYELEEPAAVRLALENRLDLRTNLGEVCDAQRRVIVAADALKAGLTLEASASAGGRRSRGSASAENAELRFDEGVYSVGLFAEAPWERTAERNAYRNRLIDYERAVRSFQEAEDRIKQEIRNALRNLLSSREAIKIQQVAMRVAARRVDSTQLFLEAGRAEIRDLLEAQESLISAQNQLTTSLVNYRVAELELQRDMGVLQVDEKGMWNEYETGRTRAAPQRD